MQNIIIRRARKKDCLRLLELIKEFAMQEKAADEVTVTLSELEEGGFGEIPVWWAFVAEIKGVICGFVLYYIRFSTRKGKRMLLESFYVSNEMQKNGIGKLLLDQLIIEAKEKEFKEITWQIQEKNEPAIHFFKKYHATFNSAWINCSLQVRR
jgi:L-amino acid N-acyltransferase YncA